MRHLVCFSLLLLLLTGCRQPSAGPHRPAAFTVDTLVDVALPRNHETDPALDWLYAAKTLVESEHRAYGDEVCLSVAFFVQALLSEQAAERYYQGKECSIGLTGMAPTLLRLLRTQGALLQSAYHTDSLFRFLPLCREVEQKADACRQQRKGADQLLQATDRLMEERIGPLPQSVFMLGCQYTPLEFGHSVCREDEYLSLTSLAQYPFGQQIVLPLKQNRYRDVFLNVPLDTLTAIVAGALRSGHTVCWEGHTGGDATETKSTPHGVTQAVRQKAFDRLETPLDKALLLVGIAHDGAGHRFFIAKDLVSGQSAYLSEDFFRLNTVAVTVAASCVPLQARRPARNDIFILPDSI